MARVRLANSAPAEGRKEGRESESMKRRTAIVLLSVMASMGVTGRRTHSRAKTCRHGIWKCQENDFGSFTDGNR